MGLFLLGLAPEYDAGLDAETPALHGMPTSDRMPRQHNPFMRFMARVAASSFCAKPGP